MNYFKIKSIFCAFILTSLVCFSGCDLITGVMQAAVENSDNKTTKTYVETGSNNNKYKIVVNTSADKIITSGNNSTSNNYVDLEQFDNLEIVENKSNFNTTPEFVNNFYSKLPQNFINNSRAATVTQSTYKEYKIGESRDFHISQNQNGNSYLDQSFELKTIGKYCRVWFNGNSTFNIPDDYLKNNPNIKTVIDETSFKNIASKFDSLYLKETDIFGSNIPKVQQSGLISVSSDTKIDILLYDIFNDAPNNINNYVCFGFFNGNDFILNYDVYDKNKNTRYLLTTSNEGEIIYIDSFCLLVNELTTYSTLSHEFQHLLNFANKYGNYKKNYESWYTEMLAMCSEEVLQNDLEISDDNSPIGRLYSWFNLWPLYGFSKMTWDSFKNSGYSGTYEYANTYAFGTFLMHNYGGVELIKEIAQNSYVNEESILKAVQKINPGKIKSFDDLLMNFTKVYINYSDDGITLNKSISQNINGNIYYLKPIKLQNSDKRIYLKSNNIAATNLQKYAKNIKTEKETRYYYFYEPVILKSEYSYEIYPYGFAVIDAGN